MNARAETPAAVFFDFAGTLFDDRALRGVHLQQLRRLAELCRAPADDAQLRAAYRRGLGVAYGQIAVSPYYTHRALFGAAYRATAEVLGAAVTAAEADRLVDRQYAATVAHAQLRPDCLDTLVALRERGRHLQIVSNIDIEQIDALVDKFELHRAVDGWTSSEEARSCKPDERIFRLALSEAGCDPRSVLFVGDTPRHDIVPPARLGMHTALLAEPSRVPVDDGGADHVVHALFEVVTLVDAAHRDGIGGQ